MSRTTAGFANADVDTQFLGDKKVRGLWRGVALDAARMNEALVLYVSIVLDSWREGDRVFAVDAAPHWMGDVERATAALVESKLLDADGRIPGHAWESWFGPAAARRDIRRESGRVGGLKSAEKAGHSRVLPSDAEAARKQGSSDGQAPQRRTQPVPSPIRSEDLDRATTTRSTARTRLKPAPSDIRLTQDELDSWKTLTAEEWEPFKAAWLARGFRFAPWGTASDDDTTQRGLLWQIAEARPHDLGVWVEKAPGRTPREVIDYVLRRWHELRREIADEDNEVQRNRAGPREPAKSLEALSQILASSADATRT